MSQRDNNLPTINDILQTARLLPGRPQFWTSHQVGSFYHTSPKDVMQQFRRNLDRFPADFWFELREDEIEVLVRQNAAPNRVNRGILIGFTRAGTLAVSGILKTSVANEVSVTIIRAFVEMETSAIASANTMVLKLRTEEMMRKRIRVQAVNGANGGLDFEAIWRMGNYTKGQIAAALRECLAMGLLDRLPNGMPMVQGDLFGVN